MVLAVAGLILLFPLPNSPNLQAKAEQIAVLAIRGDKKIGILGNSVIDHVSRCDQDQRNIPQLIAGAETAPVADLSFGGQTEEEEVNLADVALKARGISKILMFVSTTGFADKDTLDIQSSLFFRTAGNRLKSDEIAPRLRRGAYLFPAVQERHGPFTYAGVTYPDYDGIKARYFEPERMAMPCPENAGRNLKFIQAYYWNDLVQPDVWLPNIDDIVRLKQAARQARTPLTIVLLPIDFPDMLAMDPALAKAALGRKDELLGVLRQRGIDILDASQVVDAGGFADRYCACGHLNERGRRALVAAIEGRL